MVWEAKTFLNYKNEHILKKLTMLKNIESLPNKEAIKENAGKKRGRKCCRGQTVNKLKYYIIF